MPEPWGKGGEVFVGDGTVSFLDCGGGTTTVYLSKPEELYTEQRNFTELHFNKMKEKTWLPLGSR